MTQKHPADRFDVADHTERVGAHRTPSPAARAWVWIGWCALATAVIVFGGWITIRAVGSSSDAGGLPGSAPSETTVTSTTAPKVSAAAQVTVLNASGTQSLGDSAVKALVSAGFKNASGVNASQHDVTRTTIYVSDTKNLAFAAGVATALGVGQIVVSTEYGYTGDNVTIVLGSDYSG
ncbi:LytR C-terminal domain-containing protein [Gryllotalpicola sp.]|uniref:LytR C-terminal domain-containing protein n=1 Tax=Gryllotalpicola sp. TaxID=1932787 RepID=UPI00262DD3D8|nr:LytR C-terminal domain-containing protein [Gryllotalpicola sp.]